MSNQPNDNDMRERRLRNLSHQSEAPDFENHNNEPNSDDSYARRLQAEINAEIEAADSELAARLSEANGPEVDYDALDRELAERMAAEEAPPVNYDADEAFARALDEQMRRETAGPPPREPSPQPEQPQPEQRAPTPAAPTPQRRPANRNLPHHPRVAAIIKLSTRLDPATLPADEKDCTICASTFGTPNDNSETESPVRLLGCSHVFGHACIQRWLRSNTNCPQCRREYGDELYSNVDVRGESQNEEFAMAYEEGIRREERMGGEEEGRPAPEEGGEGNGDEDPFFAEPSLQQIQEEDAARDRLIGELGGGVNPRRPRLPRQPSPPPLRASSPPRAASPTRAVSPPRTGFGYGRPADPLPPPGTHPPGHGPGNHRPGYEALRDRMRREIEAERGYSGPYRDPGRSFPERGPPPGDRSGESLRERYRREIVEERGYSGRYRELENPAYERDYGPTRRPPPGSRNQPYSGDGRYPPGSRPMTDEEMEDLERRFWGGMNFGGGGRGRR